MTLIELAIALLLFGGGGMLGYQHLQISKATAKRAEATSILAQLGTLQYQYFVEHKGFAKSFDALNFTLDGGETLSPTTIRSSHYYAFTISSTSPRDWTCAAAGNIDSDAWLDVVVASAGIKAPVVLYDDVNNAHTPLGQTP